MAVGTSGARPFTATDLARLDRVSDPRVSPDGRFVAYNVRSTDWEGNRGVNAVWVLERAAAAAPPRLIRDQEKSPTAPRWSADGRWLYFFPRVPARRSFGGPRERHRYPQMTSLPLDVAFYRLAPNAPAAVVAVNAHPDCDTLPVARPRMTPRRRRKPRECSTTALPRGFGILPRRPFHRAVRAQSQRRCAAHRRRADRATRPTSSTNPTATIPHSQSPPTARRYFSPPPHPILAGAG